MIYLLNLIHVVIQTRHWQNPAPRLASRIKRTYTRSSTTLFLCLAFFDGLYGGASTRRFSFGGKANPVQPSTLLDSQPVEVVNGQNKA